MTGKEEITKKILVTGLSGFIGKQCISYLIDRNYEIFTITRDPSRIHNNKVNVIEGDLLHTGVPTKLIKAIKPDYLMHLAWYTKHQEFWDAKENLSWVRCSIELVEEFLKHHGKRFIISGSCAEYDWSYDEMDEFKTPRNPNSLFGISKNSLFNLIDTNSQLRNLSYAWARIFFTYGPYENTNKLFSSVLSKIINNEIAETTDGLQFRDFMHCNDIARALVDLIESDIQGPINIGSGIKISIKEILELIGKITNKYNLIKIGAKESRLNEPKSILAKTNRLKKELGFRPEYRLDYGIKELKDSIEKNK
jgi:nucleoside-diphosphate-sugar epimerase